MRIRHEQAALKEAYKRVSASDSHYWAFWKPAGLRLKGLNTVEVRMNVPDGEEAAVLEVSGWSIAHRASGMLFIRRDQSLDKASIRLLFKDVLRLANSKGWQFHSWQHDPNLPDWP